MSKIVYMQASNGNVFTTSFPEYHKQDKVIPKRIGEPLYKEQLKDSLLGMVKPKQTIHCVLRSVSRSGMYRRISLFTISDGHLVNIDHAASILTGRKMSDKGGIICNGCGMDMGFDLVYSLGCALWPSGTPEPHGTRNGEPDNTGGYSLRHSWI